MAGYPITPEAGRVALAEAADRPYGPAQEHLRAEHRIGLSKRTLENLVQTVGGYWLQEDAEAWEAHRNAANRPACDGVEPALKASCGSAPACRTAASRRPSNTGTPRC